MDVFTPVLVVALILSLLAIITVGAAFGIIFSTLFTMRRAIEQLNKTLLDAEGVMKAFSTGAGDMLKMVIEESQRARAQLQSFQLAQDEAGAGGVPPHVRDIWSRRHQQQAQAEDDAGPQREAPGWEPDWPEP